MKQLILSAFALLLCCPAFGQSEGLQPGDRVQLIPRDPAHPFAPLLRRDLEVDAKGHLLAKDLGVDCDVRGLRPEAAQALLQSALTEDSGLEVAALSTRDGTLLGQQEAVTLGGQVRRAGFVPFHSEMTLAEAVAAAGGASEFGATNRIRLYRDGKVYTYDLRNPEHAAIRLTRYDIIDVPMKQWVGH